MDVQSLRPLATTLDQQVQASLALNELLGREKALLTGTDAGAVEDIAAEKAALLARLEGLESERRQTLTRLGLGADASDIDRLVSGSHDALTKPTLTHIQGQWKTLLATMESCRQANEVNGEIVGIKQRQIRQLLNMLRTGRPDDLTYGPSGRTSSSLARGLARA